MTLTQDQIHEVEVFQQSLNPVDDYLFFNLALAHAANDGRHNGVTFEDKYNIMQRWDEFK